MNWFAEMALWRLLQPRVTHRLPGRLRLTVPLLRHLPDEWLELADVLEQTLAAPVGIERVRGDRHTGSLLIEYAPDKLLEAEILDYLRDLLELLRRHRHQLENLDRERALRVAEKLTAWLRAQTRTRPTIDPTARIPDELWT